VGYSVLYIAFGIVALWLLGEVLLQYKARLRWRLLAFAGFMGVAGGVALREVAVIMLGAVAFGTGQTFVTLSYKRGFAAGWAIGAARPRAGRRKGAAASSAPTLAVGPVEESHEEAPGAGADILTEGSGPAEVYQPVPMNDDSGEYPQYGAHSAPSAPPAPAHDPYAGGGHEGYGAQGHEGFPGYAGSGGPGGYADWGGDPQPAAAASYDAYGSGGYEQAGWGGQAHAYGYEQPGHQEQQPAGDYGNAAHGSGSYGSGGYEGGGYEGGYGDRGADAYRPDTYTPDAYPADAYGPDAHSPDTYGPDAHSTDNHGYDTGGYRYEGYDGYGSGGWTPPAHQEPQPPYPGPSGGPGYAPQAQPYIPQQQHQPPYGDADAHEPQPQPQPQPQYAADYDPYDPYR
jgi:uncharacterized membrane protein YgcG